MTDTWTQFLGITGDFVGLLKKLDEVVELEG